MIKLEANWYKKYDKIENKSEGISTKNYVAVDLRQKKWLKKKLSTLQNRDRIEAYIYNHILGRQRLRYGFSLLSFKDIMIQEEKDQKEGIIYYLQRQYFTCSLKDLLQSPENMKKIKIKEYLPPLLRFFIQNSSQEFPLLFPSNILLEKSWNDKFSMHLNFTSFVGYQFFSEQSQIYASRFKEIYPYLHPEIIKEKQGANGMYQLNINFKVKLYSFAMILLTLILKKDISKLDKSRSPTISIKNRQDIKDKLKQNFNKIFEMLSNKAVQTQILNMLGSYKKKDQLYKFFLAIFYKDSKFTCWMDVVNYFDPKFEQFYLPWLKQKQVPQENTPKQDIQKYNPTFHILKTMKKLYQLQPEDIKKKLKKMGVIKSTQQIQYFVLYFFYRYDFYKQTRFILKEKRVKQNYNPSLYHFIKTIEREIRQRQLEIGKGQQYDQKTAVEKINVFKQSLKLEITQESKQVNFSDEIKLSFELNNFCSIEKQDCQPDQLQGKIIIFNDVQKSFNLMQMKMLL